MMRMLSSGGLATITDGERTADDDNPRGYFELERVKQITRDKSWLDGAEGKVVKVISQLLKDLPNDRQYRVVFMRRNLDEVLASQKKMLGNRGEENRSEDQSMKELFVAHLDEVERWLRVAPHMQVCYVSYSRTIEDPAAQIARVNEFVGGQLDVGAMTAAVEPKLYRNRLPSGA
jgi:Sulfotransferase family